MEENLIDRAKDGDREALAQLLYLNYEIVFRYIIKFTLNKSRAEDLTQDTMLRAIEKFDRYDPEKSKLSTWLIKIAQNIYVDNIRKNKREVVCSDEEWQFNNSEDGHSSDVRWRMVLDALAGLEDAVRLPIVLKHYYGYSLEEISGIMSIPLGTVKSRIHYGIKLLRKELE